MLEVVKRRWVKCWGVWLPHWDGWIFTFLDCFGSTKALLTWFDQPHSVAPPCGLLSWWERMHKTTHFSHMHRERCLWLESLTSLFTLRTWRGEVRVWIIVPPGQGCCSLALVVCVVNRGGTLWCACTLFIPRCFILSLKAKICDRCETSKSINS